MNQSQSKRDRIAARAYEIWEQEGRPANKEEEHWRRAEQEVAREDGAKQMGGGSETPTAPDLDTRPAPPVEAAPPLGGADLGPEDTAQRRTRKKSSRPRKKSTDPQQS